MQIENIGIAGAGQMGSGIAHVFAKAGFAVKIFDSEPQTLETVHQRIGQKLHRLPEDEKQALLARIACVGALKELAGCDLIIESATENEAVKLKIFKDLVPYLSPQTVLASNTSSVSITRLASQTDRPERFVGIHFMNPAPVMELVELVRGLGTSDATFALASALVERIGKKSTSAEDFPAFIVNRILITMVNEAIYTLYEGVGSVESIDKALRLGARHKMGPLELADFIGLDVCLAIMNRLHEGLADRKYRPCPLLVKYVDAGWLGRKSGRGFYDYANSPPVPTR